MCLPKGGHRLNLKSKKVNRMGSMICWIHFSLRDFQHVSEMVCISTEWNVTSWTSWRTSWPAFLSSGFLHVNKNQHGESQRTHKQRGGTPLLQAQWLKEQNPSGPQRPTRVRSRGKIFKKQHPLPRNVNAMQGKFSLGSSVTTTANSVPTNCTSLPETVPVFSQKIPQPATISTLTASPTLLCPVQGKPGWLVTLDGLHRHTDFRADQSPVLRFLLGA